MSRYLQEPHKNDPFALLYKRHAVYAMPMDSSPMQTLQHESMPIILPRISDETPDAGQEDDDSRAGEYGSAPCCSVGFISSRGTTQVPASEIGQFALFCQHRSIRAHVGDAAAKGAEVRVMGDVTAKYDKYNVSRGFAFRNLLNAIEELGALVIESLGFLEIDVVVGILGDPHGEILIGRPDFTDMARETFEIAIPVDRDEIRAALAFTGVEEILQPDLAGRSAGDRRGTELDTHFLQRFNLPLPRLGRGLGRYRASTSGPTAIRLVHSKHIGYIGATLDLCGDIGKKCGGSPPKHRDELKFGVGKRRRWFRFIVVVPGQVRGSRYPYVVVGHVFGIRDVDEAPFR